MCPEWMREGNNTVGSDEGGKGVTELGGSRML